MAEIAGPYNGTRSPSLYRYCTQALRSGRLLVLVVHRKMLHETALCVVAVAVAELHRYHTDSYISKSARYSFSLDLDQETANWISFITQYPANNTQNIEAPEELPSGKEGGLIALAKQHDSQQ